MDQQLQSLRDDIPSYNDIQRKLHAYLIEKTLQRLFIPSQQFLKSIDHVFSTIQQNSNPRAQSNNPRGIKIQQRYYKLYRQDLSRFCRLLVQRIENDLVKTDPENYLTCVQDQIRSYKMYMLTVYKIFQHLDNLYLRNRKTSLHLEGAKIFKEMYMEKIQGDLVERLCFMLMRFKEGFYINGETVEFVIEHIGLCGFDETPTAITLQKPDKHSNPRFKLNGVSPYETGYFKQFFVNPLVHSIEQQYKQKSRQLLKMSTPQYVQQALRYLQLQQKVAKKFYDSASPRKIIIASAENSLANINGRAVMDNQTTGLYSMFEQRKQKQLSRIFTLIKRSDHMNYFCSILNSFVDREGTAVLEKIAPEDEKQLKREKIVDTINSLLQLKELVDRFVAGPFLNDVKVQQSRDHAFQGILNKSNKTINFLCYYADLELRKSKGDNEDFSTMISSVIRLYQYLYSADTFLKIYQKLLTMRILNDQFKNRDAQIQIINKLKSQSGASALTKITTMISDIDLSQKFYNDNIKHSKAFNQDYHFHVTLLTTGSWPIQDYKSGRSLVPRQLQPRVELFEALYATKFPGKALNWIFMYGSGELECRFGGNTHTLKVSGFQMVVMLLFQSSQVKGLTVQQIHDEVKPKQQANILNMAISQLIKLKVLLKDGQQSKLQPSNHISYNQSFTHKLKRFVCIQTQKYVQKPNQQVTEDVMRDRQLVIDCIVVRVMKTRKAAKYEEIIQETCKLCKNFKCEVGMVKRRLETLIEKEYLKRDEKETNVLIYIPS